MTQHIYIFGSICRGEYDDSSDIDLLACTDDESYHFDTSKFSVYKYGRLNEMWSEGNPFAWHLFLESKLVYSSDGRDYLKELGKPGDYNNGLPDCLKFKQLFDESVVCLFNDKSSYVFHLSCIFLSIRNFATCYSLHTKNPVFSRYSSKHVSPSLKLNDKVFDILLQARILSTRGIGGNISYDDVQLVKENTSIVNEWMKKLLEEGFK